MIITLKGCTASAYIGGLNFYSVSKGTVSGATVTINTSTISKDAATSTSARDIATVALNSGYENLVVTVTMGGSAVNNWYADGKVTIPANTEVTGAIKISASATVVSGGEVVDPEPEEPGTGDGSDTDISLVNAITPSTEGIIMHLDKSANPGYTITDTDTYITYEYTIPYDCSIYIPSEGLRADYVALVVKSTGTRYRKSETNLPTVDNPLALNAGEQIYITYTKAASMGMFVICNNAPSINVVKTESITSDMMTKQSGWTVGSTGINENQSYDLYSYTIPSGGGRIFVSGMDNYTYFALLIRNEQTGQAIRYRYSDNQFPTTAHDSWVSFTQGCIVYVTVPTGNDVSKFDMQLLYISE